MRYPIRQLLLTIFLAATVSLVQAQKTFTALELSEKLETISSEMFQKTKVWTDVFPEALKTGNYALLKPYREDLQQFIETNIKYVATLKDVKNFKPLREAFLEFLTYEKKVVVESFMPFEVLKADTSLDELKKMVAKMTALGEKEPPLFAKLTEAKEKYKAGNNFTTGEK